MRAVVAFDGKLEVRDVDQPEPGPGEVLVKTLACGICGSDLHALKDPAGAADASTRAGGMPAADPGKPVVAGHEFCAEIVSYGSGTTGNLPIGSRVCAEPILLTPEGTVDPVGFSHRSPGGYGQYMRLMEGLLVPVPDHVSDAEAALTEPLAVGIHAVNAARTDVDHVPIVIGCGPVGLAVIAALKLNGYGPIIAADYSAVRRELATHMGAEHVVDPAEQSPYELYRTVAVVTDGNAAERPIWNMGPQLRPQVIYECVGVPGILQRVFEGAEPHARIVVVGVCLEEDRYEPIFAIYRQLDVKFVFGHSLEEFQQALDVIAEGEIPFREIISAECPLEDVPHMFEALTEPDCHAKVIVKPWG